MLKIRLRKARFLIVAILAGAGAIAHSVAANAPCEQYRASTLTVHDDRTKLVWQRSYANAMVWSDAVSYCHDNKGQLPGCGWRLPSVKELQTIVDDTRETPSIHEVVFPGVSTDAFWTSTVVGGGSQALTVVFYEGFLETREVGGPSARTALVRCVR